MTEAEMIQLDNAARAVAELLALAEEMERFEEREGVPHHGSTAMRAEIVRAIRERDALAEQFAAPPLPSGVR